jgi:hypothetical protein
MSGEPAQVAGRNRSLSCPYALSNTPPGGEVAPYTPRPVDALFILLGGAVLAAGLWSWLARPRSGGPRRRDSPLGLRSARQIIEDREALEAEDLAQLLAASNARRRRRGEAERTVEDVERLVAREAGEQNRRREALLAERELDGLLDATNARRRARGLPERSREDVRREYGGGSAWPAA